MCIASRDQFFREEEVLRIFVLTDADNADLLILQPIDLSDKLVIHWSARLQ